MRVLSLIGTLYSAELDLLVGLTVNYLEVMHIVGLLLNSLLNRFELVLRQLSLDSALFGQQLVVLLLPLLFDPLPLLALLLQVGYPTIEGVDLIVSLPESVLLVVECLLPQFLSLVLPVYLFLVLLCHFDLFIEPFNF